MKLILLIIPLLLLSCERECNKNKNFRPHKVQHCNKSKIYTYYHNNPCDCKGIDVDLCLSCNFQKTYKNYVFYYDNNETIWGN